MSISNEDLEKIRSIINSSGSDGQSSVRPYAEFAKKMVEQIVSDPNDYMKSNRTIRDYDKDDYIDWINSPQKNVSNLRNLSRLFYMTSPEYYNAIDFKSNMLTYDYAIFPYGFDMSSQNLNKLTKTRLSMMRELEKMSIRHEFSIICRRVVIDGVAYGVEFEDDSSYFIRLLDPEYCQIISKQDGVFNFAFDFSYFDSKSEVEFLKFPSYFKRMYDNYKNAGRKGSKKSKAQRWQQIPSDSSICIKFDESIDESFPPLSGSFGDLFDLMDFKSLRLQRETLKNYAFLTGEIPMRKDSKNNNSFSIDKAIVDQYVEEWIDAFDGEIPCLPLPLNNIQSHQFNKQSYEDDIVGKAERDWFTSCGIPSTIVGGSTDFEEALKYEIKYHEQQMFFVLRQFERWINRRFKLKPIDSKIKFTIKFIETSAYNRITDQKAMLEAAKYAIPNKLMAASLTGMTPLEIEYGAYLENVFLNLNDSWRPLSSTYTQSSNTSSAQTHATAGRPVSELANKIDDTGDAL